MEIRGKRALVLGGAGLVGQAICRALVERGIGEIVVSSLFEEETKGFVDVLKKEFGGRCPKLHAEWGNVFVRQRLKDLSRDALLSDRANREILIGDLLEPLNRDILTSSVMFRLCETYNPHIVIDSINTATAISYQNLFGAAKETRDMVRRSVKESGMADQALAAVEKLLITQYLPQLIRHVQIFLSSMVEAKSECYLKIGTCGTGGMGLNIPYTHSEDKPSQMLLAKSSIAGAHSLLLFLMGRTPGGPIIKELKPAAAIAWKRIACGPVKRGGKPILLEDVRVENSVKLEDVLEKTSKRPTTYLVDGADPKALVAPFIDTGENGLFSLGEFETLTDEGQMEFITPEEIAEAAVRELSGRNTGFDIVAALDSSTMGPTFRAGYMRKQALESLREEVSRSGIDSVAFEILGPPRLSKILYEGYLLRRLFKTFEAVEKTRVDDISRVAEELISGDAELLSRIVSIGIPILAADGKLLIRGKNIAIPAGIPGHPDATFEISSRSVEGWAHDGWVDLRPGNWKRWQERMKAISEEVSRQNPFDTSSHSAKSSHYWMKSTAGIAIEEAKLASWIFIHEDEGERMKA
ncbi:MAG: short-chain dehydrogenase [Pseudomonadota bacterium]